MTTNSQYRQSAEIVEKIHRILGLFRGYRTLHADGRFYRGTFKALPAARDFTRAPHLQGAELPVSVRFSKGGGDPFSHFGNTVGMATRFYLPDGDITNLVMLSQKLFIARSIEQFIGLLEAGLPTTPEGPPNMKGVMAFLANNPNSGAVFKMRSEAPAPVSFAHTEFHGVHAFRFVDAANTSTHVRCHWTPAAGIRGQPIEDLKAKAPDALFAELDARLQREQVHHDLVLELAEPGDPLDDATALWPDARRRVTIGRLSLTAPLAEADLPEPLMNHDPSQLTDGIEPTDDPILQIRRGVYQVSAAMRSEGWHKSPFAKVADSAHPDKR